VAPLKDAPIRFQLMLFAAAVCAHNLKTYYVITTIEKSEKFVGGGGGGGIKRLCFN